MTRVKSAFRFAWAVLSLVGTKLSYASASRFFCAVVVLFSSAAATSRTR